MPVKPRLGNQRPRCGLCRGKVYDPSRAARVHVNRVDRVTRGACDEYLICGNCADQLAKSVRLRAALIVPRESP